MQRFLQWSSVCSPAVPVVFRGESQDPDNSETLVIINTDITIYDLLQRKMRDKNLECDVKNMEDWFEGKTYNEMAVVVTLSAVETVAIVSFAASEQSFLRWEQIIFELEEYRFQPRGQSRETKGSI